MGVSGRLTIVGGALAAIESCCKQGPHWAFSGWTIRWQSRQGVAFLLGLQGRIERREPVEQQQAAAEQIADLVKLAGKPAPKAPAEGAE